MAAARQELSSLPRPARVEALEVAAYRIPTDQPESDGTLEWSATTIVVVEALCEGVRGLGYTYAGRGAASVVEDTLRPAVLGGSALAPGAAYHAMRRAIRNLGQQGLAAMALSAVDCALWDLQARLLELPLVDLLGAVRDAVPVYGSGGFTSYAPEQLEQQLGGWAEAGLRAVKMKVGRAPSLDLSRVAVARSAVGPNVSLFVDANGAYECEQAARLGALFADRFGVAWYEEPRPSSDLEGLRRVHERVPPGLELAAGEYGSTPEDFQLLLDAQAIDCLQADVTRCGGISGFLGVAAQCEARQRPLSAHCAPALHVALGCALAPLRHLEWCHDHVRLEQMLFEGAPRPVDGLLRPDRSRSGNGLSFRHREARDRAA